jgi:predicted transcriptional regulator
MARRKKPPEERRDNQLKIRLTDPERADVDDAAARQGLRATEFLRRLALGRRQPPSAVDQQAIADLLNEFNRNGNNLNQLTRAVNAGRLAPLDELRTVLDRHNALMDRLAPLLEVA